MSDAPEASERALRSLQDEGSGSSRTPLLNAKIERSLSPPLRPSSPDLTCAICLGEITDKSVTDSCFHRFCFSCLSEWSKVKPECPLCKARFTAIYHGIKSMNDFQVYRLDHSRNISQPLDSLDAAAAAAALDPHIFINVAVQRAFTGRFGYRTTMGLNRTRGPGGHYIWGPPGGHDVMGPVPVSLPHPPSSGPLRVNIPSYPSQSSSAAGSSSISRRASSRQQAAEFRKNVYRQNLWARPIDQNRIRESSPEFYRTNLAQTHRLVPWLARELNALSDIGTGFRFDLACRDILQWIRTYPINSADFKRHVSVYLEAQSDHFVHEFYQFAISPYDMLGYDMQTRYTPSTAEQAVTQNGSDAEDDMEIDNELPLLPFNLSVHDPLSLRACIGPIGRPTRNISGRPRGFSAQTLANFDLPSYLFPPSRVLGNVQPEPAAPPEVIVLSSSEENEANESADSDSEVQIIGSLPPLHLRPPEQVIDLDDSNDSDVIEIKVPSPPLIEIDDDNDDSPRSPPAPSTSNDVAGPSGMQRAEGHLTRSSARFFRPSYREYSSSSEDEVLSKKKSSKKKAGGGKKNTRASKRSRAPKSSKFVESESEESDDSNRDSKDVKGRRATRKGLLEEARKRRKSRDHSASHSSRRDQDSEGSGVSKRNSSLPSKILASKNSSKSKIDDCDRCGKKRRARNGPDTLLTVASSPERCHTKQQKRKRRKNSGSVSSDDDSSPPRRRKKTKSRHDSSSSSTASQERDHSASSSSSSFNDSSYVEGSNLARNPKAMSKKAMILRKRAAETSSPDGPPAYRYGEMVELRSPTYYSMVLDNQVGYTDRAKGSFEMADDSDSSSSTTLSMGTESAPPRPFEGLQESLHPSFSALLSGPRSPSSSSLASSGRAVASSPLMSNALAPPSPRYSPAKLTLKSDSIPSGPPSIASPSSDSSTTRSTVTSPAPHSNNSWPELSASQPVPDVQTQSETQPPSSPPNLRRFDDSPIITLEHSPLMSAPENSSLWNSSSESPSSSPPRLRSIVTRVSSPPRSPSRLVSHTNSDNSTSDEED